MTAEPKATSLFALHTRPVSQAKVGKCFRSMLKEHRNDLVKGKCGEAVARVRLKVLIVSPVVQTESDSRDDQSDYGEEEVKRRSMQPSTYHSLKRFPLILSKLLHPATSASFTHYRSHSVQRPGTALARHISARRPRNSVVSSEKEASWINEFGRSLSNGGAGLCPDIVKETLSHGYVKYFSPKARAKSPARWEAASDLHIGLPRRRRTYRRSQSRLE